MTHPYLLPHPHPHPHELSPLDTSLDTLKLLGRISDTYDRPRAVFSEHEPDAAPRIGVVTPHKPRISCLFEDVAEPVRAVPCYESPVSSQNSCCELDTQPGPSTSRTSRRNSSASSLVCASLEHTPIFDLTELQLMSKSPLERLGCITKNELKKLSKRRHQRSGHPRSVAPPAQVTEPKPSDGLAKTDKPLPPLPQKHPVSAPHRPSKDYYKEVDSILAKARQKRDERVQGQLTQREPTKTNLSVDYRHNSDYELHHPRPLIPISLLPS